MAVARRSVSSLVGLWSLGIVVGLFWLIEAVDSVLLGSRLERYGIHPRDADGLVGVASAPFLHGPWRHLIANTVPFAVLGGLVLTRGRATWVQATMFVVLAGGAATWLLGRGGNHIGASGVVFGYLGFLVASAVVERSVAAILAAVAAVVLYGGIVWGVVPRGTVSWEGHLFGLLAGVAAAFVLRRRTAERSVSP